MKLNKFFQNFLFISGGQVVSLALNFLSLTLVARFLGVEDYGQFNYILAIAVILSKLVDFGLGPIAYREFADKQQDTILNSAISIRIFLLFLVVILYNILAIFLKFPLEETILASILLINVIISSKFQNIRELLDIPFKIKTLSKYSTYAIIIDNLLFLILVFLIPIFNLGIIYAVVAYIVSNIPGFILVIFFLKRRGNYSFQFDLAQTKYLIREAIPLMGYVALITIYQQVDILILKNIDNSYSAGIFSAAARLTMPFNIIPAAVVSTIFPLMVANANRPEKANQLNSLIYKALFFISFTITVVSVFKAEEIVILIFGRKYGDSAVPFIFLSLTQIFLFYNFFTVDLLTAHNKQKTAFLYSILLAFLSVSIAFLLIPQYSFNGAGYAKLASIIIGFLFLYFQAKKLKVNVKFFNFRMVIVVVLITGLLLLISFLPLLYYLIISLVVVVIITIKLKYFSDREMITIFGLFNREKWAEQIIKM